MKFLVDEQLPGLLAEWLQSKGYDAIHVATLLTGTRIPDGLICRRSMEEQRVVISKDVDFFNTYFIKRQPYKLIYVTTGNIKNRQLLDLFRGSLDELIGTLEQHQVVEIDQHSIRVWY